jgi:hypothetical protein
VVDYNFPAGTSVFCPDEATRVITVGILDDLMNGKSIGTLVCGGPVELIPAPSTLLLLGLRSDGEKEMIDL